MNNWNSFIVGPPACGKSTLAEMEIESMCSQPLYIGTLPVRDEFQERIDNHTRRRDERWLLLENLEFDDGLLKLRHFMHLVDGVLVDGISSLLWCLVETKGMGKSELTRFIGDFFMILSSYGVENIIFVDCIVPFPGLGKNYWFNKFIDDVHGMIRESSSHYVLLSKTYSRVD